MKKLAISIFCFFQIAVCCAEAKWVHLRALSPDLTFYDTQTKLYLPLLPESYNKVQAAHLYINAGQWNSCGLRFFVQYPTTIFINQQLYAHVRKPTQVYLPLRNVVIFGKTDHPLITFYSPHTLLPTLREINMVKVDNALISSPQLSATTLPIQEKVTKDSAFKSTFLLFSICLLSVMAFTRNRSPRLFQSYFAFDIFWPDLKSTSDKHRVGFERLHIAYVIISCFLFSLGAIGVKHYTDLYLSPTFSGLYNAYNVFITELLILFIAAIGFYVAKFGVVYCICHLFSLPKVALLHFKEYINIAVLFSLFFFCITALFTYTSLFKPEYLSNTLFYLMLLFLVLNTFKISILINNILRFKNLYLISYLCITEWIPFFLVIKLYSGYTF